MRVKPFYLQIFIFLFFWPTVLLEAQKEDAIWLFGNDNSYWPVEGGMDLLFDTPDTPIILKHYRNMDFWAAQASICDSAGNLLFYTNGCDIFNGRDVLIENGDNINAGIVHDNLCDDSSYGFLAYPSRWQTILVLPQPGHSGIYYLFHLRINRMPPGMFNEDLLYTKIDMQANLGAGKVLEKNVLVMRDSFPFGELTAVKHGNGTDWWVVIPKRVSNTYFKFKLTSAGITDTLVQTIGDGLKKQYEGSDQSAFSPDGSLALRFQGTFGGALDATCQIRYFDRLSGEFTGYESLVLAYDQSVPNGSCAISPSGQFGYVMSSWRVYQIDLWASDIAASQVTVGWFDGFLDPVGITFGKSVLGPDCKIYITGSGDTKWMHTIHNPDVKGIGCNLELRSLQFPWQRAATIPFPPNYRLGPIDNPGDPCFKRDTSTTSIGLVDDLDTRISVWPNPFKLEVKVQTQSDEVDQIRVTDMAGKVVADRITIGGITHIPADTWPQGCYFVQCIKNGIVLTTHKTVKIDHSE